MERRHFLSQSSKTLLLASAGAGLAGSCKPVTKEKFGKTAAGPVKHPGYPMAITMWDFSWLERRWSGAGYEDWDLALDELAERGYNCIRIDAFPHLIAADPDREWWLDPHWDNMVWGESGPQ